MGLSDLKGKRHAPESLRIKKTNPKPVHLEPHICRHCFGRIASHEIFLSDGSLGREYICTNCGAAAEGHDASVLCCCGIKVRKAGEDTRAVDDEVDAGIRCYENPNPTPAFPALIVASVGGGSD